MERRIRAYKRTQEALEAAGETEYAKTVKKRIAAENKALRAYCDKEGLAYRQDRTQIYGYSDTSRKKKVVDFVETVDKTGQGGIIKGRSSGNGISSSEHYFKKVGKIDFNDQNAIDISMNDFEEMYKDSFAGRLCCFRLL